MLIIITMAIDPSSSSVVAAFLLLGLRKAGTPLEIASTPVSAAHPEEKARANSRISAIWVRGPSRPGSGTIVEVGRLGRGEVAAEVLHHPEHGHPQDGDHEAIGGDRKQRARLPDSPQVHRSQQDHQRAGHLDLVRCDPAARRRGVLHARGDRHRHGEHVVDQQGAGHGHARGLAQVDRGHLVVAPAARVGVDVLTVRRHHGEHHHADRDPDLPGPGVRRGAGHRQHDEDLVRGVGDRRQRVTGEDRQRDPLGKQRLAQL